MREKLSEEILAERSSTITTFAFDASGTSVCECGERELSRTPTAAAAAATASAAEHHTRGDRTRAQRGRVGERNASAHSGLPCSMSETSASSSRRLGDRLRPGEGASRAGAAIATKGAAEQRERAAAVRRGTLLRLAGEPECLFERPGLRASTPQEQTRLPAGESDRRQRAERRKHVEQALPASRGRSGRSPAVAPYRPRTAASSPRDPAPSPALAPRAPARTPRRARPDRSRAAPTRSRPAERPAPRRCARCTRRRDRRPGSRRSRAPGCRASSATCAPARAG